MGTVAIHAEDHPRDLSVRSRGLVWILVLLLICFPIRALRRYYDDDEFRFNDTSTHEGHLRQNDELTWFCNETVIMISHICI